MGAHRRARVPTQAHAGTHTRQNRAPHTYHASGRPHRQNTQVSGRPHAHRPNTGHTQTDEWSRNKTTPLPEPPNTVLESTISHNSSLESAVSGSLFPAQTGRPTGNYYISYNALDFTRSLQTRIRAVLSVLELVRPPQSHVHGPLGPAPQISGPYYIIRSARPLHPPLTVSVKTSLCCVHRTITGASDAL